LIEPSGGAHRKKRASKFMKKTLKLNGVNCSKLLAAIDEEHRLAESNMSTDLTRKDYSNVYGWQCQIYGLLKARDMICSHILKASTEKDFLK
jgi:hypothetical protein